LCAFFSVAEIVENINPPDAVDDSFEVPPGNSVSIQLSLFDNDSEPDGEDFFIESVVQPTTGSVVIDDADNGLVTYTYSGGALFTGISFDYTITDSTVSICPALGKSDTATVFIDPQPDTDGDLVADISDLDDDNDGILDSVECPNAYQVLWVTQDAPETEEQNTIDKLTALGYNVTVVDDNVGGDANNYAVTFIYEDANSGTAFANVANLVTTTNGVITSETYLHDEIIGANQGVTTSSNVVNITDNTHPITQGLALGNYDIANASYRANSMVSGTVLGLHPNGEKAIVVWEPGDALDSGIAAGRRAIVPHANDGLGGFNSAGEDLLVNAIIWVATRDTDKDGIADCLDSDSDNDGCGDADEAYGDTNSDVDDNGMYGTGNPPVNGDGAVTAASYSTPVDADTNSIPEYLEVGSVPAIIAQPSDIVLCPGCNGSFSVSSTGADTFHWQVFNGSDWADLSDSGMYSGTSTNTLVVSGATSSENGNLYRVILSNSTFVCTILTSSTAILTVQVNSVITNRRITYRVNKN